MVRRNFVIGTLYIIVKFTLDPIYKKYRNQVMQEFYHQQQYLTVFMTIAGMLVSPHIVTHGPSKYRCQYAFIIFAM